MTPTDPSFGDANDRDGDDAPSRSQRKRDAEALQKLGERLAELGDSQLDDLGLPAELLDSIRRIRTMRRGGGLRRERQRIGKLMRQIDTTRIEAVLANKDAERRNSARRFHRLEELRDRLLEGDESAQKELAELTDADTATEAQRLARHAHEEAIRGQPPAAARALFRLIRDRVEGE